MSDKKAKVKAAPKKKVAKKKVARKKAKHYSLFAKTEEGDLTKVEMELSLKIPFIKKFGTQSIPVKSEFDEWIKEIS